MPEKTHIKIFLIVPFLLVLSWFFFPSQLWEKLKTARFNEEITSGIAESSKPEPGKQPDASQDGDIEFQKPLANPPREIKAIYVTSESAANPEKMASLIALVRKAGLNAMVIDIKDSSGYLSYNIAGNADLGHKTRKKDISKINSFVKNLHDENIYAIARIVVFQDPVLAAQNPELAIKNGASGGLWKDNRNLAWIDPASRESWDYNAKIAQDAARRGFDEINFDYIRFPSDGRLSEMAFPFYDPKNTSKKEAIKDFFAYLRANLASVRISADIFGLTTVGKDDLGIGQTIEDAYENFDYASPMVYPSHYRSGFLGYENPADYPFEVVKYSIENAARRLEEYNEARENSEQENKIKNTAAIRPWIQAFNLGAIYDISKIKAQIKASDQAGGIGWMLWNPANNYSFLNDF